MLSRLINQYVRGHTLCAFCVHRLHKEEDVSRPRSRDSRCRRLFLLRSAGWGEFWVGVSVAARALMIQNSLTQLGRVATVRDRCGREKVRPRIPCRACNAQSGKTLAIRVVIAEAPYQPSNPP